MPRCPSCSPRSAKPEGPFLVGATASVSGGLCAGRAPARGECRQAGVQRHARAPLAAGRRLLVPAGIAGRIVLRQGRPGERAADAGLRSRGPRALPDRPRATLARRRPCPSPGSRWRAKADGRQHSSLPGSNGNSTARAASLSVPSISPRPMRSARRTADGISCGWITISSCGMSRAARRAGSPRTARPIAPMPSRRTPICKP